MKLDRLKFPENSPSRTAAGGDRNHGQQAGCRPGPEDSVPTAGVRLLHRKAVDRSNPAFLGELITALTA